MALEVAPPFREYYFVDLDGQKVGHLRSVVGDRPDVHILEGDCNQILTTDVLPRIQFRNYRRAFCLLDPYGLHLDWRVIEAAGKSRAIDLFLNFPIMDMNRNALWRESERVTQANRDRMTAFWGDTTWKGVAYQPSGQLSLIGPPDIEKQGNEVIAEAFRRRLRDVAGFARVPEPLPMRNSQGAIVYYLFFASQKDVADQIVHDIFGRYRSRGA